jgi:branched-chain amino acid transport system ATP-binding protein
LLDEPFAGSDSASADAMVTAVMSVADSGCGVILVDHNVDIVAILVDRIILLNHGVVVFDGDPDACLQSDEMREVYFGGVSAHDT